MIRILLKHNENAEHIVKELMPQLHISKKKEAETYLDKYNKKLL